MSNQEERNQKYPISVQHGKPRLGKLKKGWIRVSIGDLFDEVSRPVKMDDNEFYELVTVKRSRGGVIKREKLQGKNIAVKSQFYVKQGDFLISKRQIVHGACGFVPQKLDGAIVSNEYLVLHCKNIIIPSFLNYLKDTIAVFSHMRGNKILERLTVQDSNTPHSCDYRYIYFQQVCFHSSIGVHVEKMLFKVSSWYKWKIDIPTLKEQEKIANFLRAVDNKLIQLRRKKELLETYKRGLMQKLFSQQIRFKQDDFTAFPDWQEKKLGDIAKFLKGKGLSKDDLADYGSLKCIRYAELYTIYDEVINHVVSSTNINPKNLVLSIENDVIIPSSGESAIEIEKASCVKFSGIALGGDLNIIRSPMNGEFLAYSGNRMSEVYWSLLQ